MTRRQTQNPRRRGALLQRVRSIAEDAGQSLMEFALILPIVLLLITTTVEVGRLYYTRLTVRHITLEATRFAVTGNQLSAPDAEDPMSRAESIEYFIRSRSEGFMVGVDSILLNPQDGGAPGEVVRVTVNYRYIFTLPFVESLFPEGVGYYRVSTAMKNEPFE